MPKKIGKYELTGVTSKRGLPLVKVGGFEPAARHIWRASRAWGAA